MAGNRELRALRKQLVLPSMAELPSGASIEALPFLGRTWYRRGVAYWICRAWMSLIFAFLPMMNLALVVAALHAVTRGATVLYDAGLICLALSAPGSAWYCYRRLDESFLRQVNRINSPVLADRAQLGRATKLSCLTPAISFVTGGFAIAAVLRTFAPMVDQEIAARVRLLNSVYRFRKEVERVEQLRKRHPHEYEEAAAGLGVHGADAPQAPARPVYPAEWRRVFAPDLPRGFTMLSLPIIGTTWYERGPAYWRARRLASARYFALGLLYALLWALALFAIWHATHGSAVFWLVVAAELILAGYAVTVGFFERHLHWVLKRALQFATPGWLIGYALRIRYWPQLDGEDIARADLEAQQAAPSYAVKRWKPRKKKK